MADWTQPQPAMTLADYKRREAELERLKTVERAMPNHSDRRTK